tara:strand:- start:1376 stop:1879 length:504 start_codon:yes stop_codon:yes gene_type:complete
MSKYIKLPIATVKDSGTTTADTTDKLVQSGQNFTTTVAVGDYVYNSTTPASATVTAVDSDTTLSLSADIMGNSEAYVILSPTASDQSVLVLLDAIVLATQSNTLTTVIQTSAAANDTVTITHTALAKPLFAAAVEAAMIAAAHPNSRPVPAETLSVSGAVIESIAVS